MLHHAIVDNCKRRKLNIYMIATQNHFFESSSKKVTASERQRIQSHFSVRNSWNQQIETSEQIQHSR